MEEHMRLSHRSVFVAILVALAAVTVPGVHGLRSVSAYTPVVVLYDNDAPGQPPGNPGRGFWGFGPQHLTVTQGDQVTFVMAQTNTSSHTVTSLSWSGTPTSRVLESGSQFNSSPTAQDYLKAGATWNLDTTSLSPNQYIFYCSIHPWEIGTLTVTAAS
jgi:plastocyanin